MPHAYEIYIEKETETSFQGFSSAAHKHTLMKCSVVENCSIEELKGKKLKRSFIKYTQRNYKVKNFDSV